MHLRCYRKWQFLFRSRNHILTQLSLNSIVNLVNASSLPDTRTLLEHFRKSRYGPTVIRIDVKVPLIRSIQKPRWNFQKANLHQYSKEVKTHLRWIEPSARNNKLFMRVIHSAAKRNIFLGYIEKSIYHHGMGTLK